MKLLNIVSLGRYKNKDGKEYNIKKGRNAEGRSTDHIFYLYRNKRQLIGDKDFYDNYTKIKTHG